MLSDEERAAALALLTDPKLLDRILEDFARCGVVGEETNKLVGYLAAVSRKLDRAAGGHHPELLGRGQVVADGGVLAFVPPEERVKYSAMTGQSLFYMGENDLKHKVLAIVEEEGAERASYALKLLQSEGELTIASTGKDPATGRLVTQEYRVEGPVMIFLTTTADRDRRGAAEPLPGAHGRRGPRADAGDPRLQRERQTLEGLLAARGARGDPDAPPQRPAPAASALGRQPLRRELTLPRRPDAHAARSREVPDPHPRDRAAPPAPAADQDGDARRRRDPSTSRSTLDDIALANRLADEVLGRSLDELPPQTRRLLGLLDEMVAESERAAKDGPRDVCASRRRDVREHTGWGNTQLKVHLARLEDLEYLLVHRGGRGQSFVYELLYDGRGQGRRAVPDRADRRSRSYDESPVGVGRASGRGVVGPKSGGGRGLVGPDEIRANLL